MWSWLPGSMPAGLAYRAGVQWPHGAVPATLHIAISPGQRRDDEQSPGSRGAQSPGPLPADPQGTSAKRLAVLKTDAKNAVSCLPEQVVSVWPRIPLYRPGAMEGAIAAILLDHHLFTPATTRPIGSGQ